MGVMDSTGEEPRSRLRRYIIGGVVFALLMGYAVWTMVRYNTEKQTVAAFLDTLVAGDTQRAYQLWKPAAAYTYQDFLSDWGPQGAFGPVKSYRITRADRPRDRRGNAIDGATAVVIVVEVSPHSPFPDNSAPHEQLRAIQEITLWVEPRDQSISFAPGLF